MRHFAGLLFSVLVSFAAVAGETPVAGRFSLEDVYAPVVATRGMVVTEEELATDVGVAILRRGEEDRGHAVHCRDLLQRRQQFEAIHAGHHHVEQY